MQFVAVAIPTQAQLRGCQVRVDICREAVDYLLHGQDEVRFTGERDGVFGVKEGYNDNYIDSLLYYDDDDDDDN